jgi:hypothetical protein
MKNVQLLARICRGMRGAARRHDQKSGKTCRKHGGHQKICKMRANRQGEQYTASGRKKL